MMTTMKKFSFKKVFKCMVCKDNASLCAGQISNVICACNSVGQSTCLLSKESRVRAPPRAPRYVPVAQMEEHSTLSMWSNGNLLIN